jgi:nucleoside triphosphatase
MKKQIYPEVAVGALIFNTENKLLLMKSHKWRNKYVIPGGHVEFGERLEDALKREVKEETGLKIYDIKLIGVQDFIFDRAYYKRKHFVFIDYCCKTNSTNVKLNNEAQSHKWVSIDETSKLPVEPYTRKTIEGYLGKR